MDFANVLGTAAMIGSIVLSPIFGGDPFGHIWRDGLAEIGLQEAGSSLSKGGGFIQTKMKNIPVGRKTESVEEERKAYKPLMGVPVHFDCGPLVQFIRVTDGKGKALLDFEPIGRSLEEPFSITVTASVEGLSDTKTVVLSGGK